VKAAYADFLRADARDRAGAYEQATTVWPTTPALIEKDLWVCATLDTLFGDVPDAFSSLVFKGGTSLSKAHRLISRFSEDVDLVVVRAGLGFDGDDDPMVIRDGLTGNKRQRLVKALREACAAHVSSHLAPTVKAALAPLGATIEIDPEDPQTILVHYPPASGGGDQYNLPTVKIEAGARGAVLPAHEATIAPYVADVLPDSGMATVVVAIDAERTFLEKLLLVHGRHCHFRDKGSVYKDANRESRHYYDLMMMSGTIATKALADTQLIDDVITHSSLAFASAWARHDEAATEGMLISPPDGMRREIARDYEAMSGMILGDAPPFEEVMAAIDDIAARYAAGRVPPTRK